MAAGSTAAAMTGDTDTADILGKGLAAGGLAAGAHGGLKTMGRQIGIGRLGDTAKGHHADLMHAGEQAIASREAARPLAPGMDIPVRAEQHLKSVVKSPTFGGLTANGDIRPGHQLIDGTHQATPTSPTLPRATAGPGETPLQAHVGERGRAQTELDNIQREHARLTQNEADAMAEMDKVGPKLDAANAELRDAKQTRNLGAAVAGTGAMGALAGSAQLSDGTPKKDPQDPGPAPALPGAPAAVEPPPAPAPAPAPAPGAPALPPAAPKGPAAMATPAAAAPAPVKPVPAAVPAPPPKAPSGFDASDPNADPDPVDNSKLDEGGPEVDEPVAPALPPKPPGWAPGAPMPHLAGPPVGPPVAPLAPKDTKLPSGFDPAHSAADPEPVDNSVADPGAAKPGEEELAPPDPKAEAAAAAGEASHTSGPQQPADTGAVQAWLQDPQNQKYLMAGAGLTAAGALAYMLTKKRSRHDED